MTDASPIAGLEVDPMDQTEVIEVSHLSRRLEAEFATPVKPPSDKGHVEPGDEHMKVYLRVRPFSDSEINCGENQGCFEISNAHTVLAHAPKDSHTFKSSKHGLTKSTHKFTFSHIFNDKTSQKEFFDSTMLGTVKDFVDGQNCLVFTYGVTNAGKTYTIQGEPKDAGILPRALDVLFNSIEGRQWESMSLKPQMFCDVKRLTIKQIEAEAAIKEEVLKRANDDDPDVGQLMGDETTEVSRLTSSTMSEDSLMAPKEGAPYSKPDDEEDDAVFDEVENRVREDAAIDVESQGQIKFSVWVSFLELYNEQVFDLLEAMPRKKNARRTVLQLREDKRGIPYVKGLKEVQVTSADEAYKLLTIGQKNLQTACTRLNHNSSRSHCIFTIKLLRVVDKVDPHVARVSMLSLCDLAGSERWTKTQSIGDRIKEAANINTSLLTLGKCIKILRHNQQYRDNPHIVPFRESKITRIFQSFFSGKGKASMIVNINQCATMFDETLHALKYSAVAKQVIVTQEQEKPPPQEKRRPKNKSSRLVSLALAQANDGRMSIPWATPGTLKTLAEMEEQAAASAIPEEDEDLDTTFTSDKENELLEVIEQLKAALKEEKRNNLKIESRVREEVCNEMAQQLVEIERNYSDMLEEERARAEERAEKRVEMYIQSVKKKSVKRKRVEDDHEMETVPLSQLQALQAKLADREGEISDLQDRLENFEGEIEQLQASLKAAIREKEEAIQETSKLKFNISALKMDVENASKMLQSVKSCSVNTSNADLGQAGVLQSLSDQVQQLKEELDKKNNLNKELSDMLSEAGETFEENQTLIKQLQATISSYEKRVSKDTGTPPISSQRLTSVSSGFCSDTSDTFSQRPVPFVRTDHDRLTTKPPTPPPVMVKYDHEPGVRRARVPTQANHTVCSPQAIKCDSPGGDQASVTFSAFNPVASSTMHALADQSDLGAHLVDKAEQALDIENIRHRNNNNVVKMMKRVFSPRGSPYKKSATVEPLKVEDFKQPLSPKVINKSMSNAAKGSKFIAKHTTTSRLRMIQNTSAAPKPSKRQCTEEELNVSLVAKVRNAFRHGLGGGRNTKSHRQSQGKRRSSVGVKTRSRANRKY